MQRQTTLKKRTPSSTRPPTRRAQGRPADAEDAVGRDVLIQAARELLEMLPPSKVTRAAVARHAGVDPSLIRYYFKDRPSLMLAVFEYVLRQNEQMRLRTVEGTAAERLRAFVQGFFAFLRTNPFFHRFLLEEIAVSELAAARKAFQRINQAAIGRFKELLADGARDGSLRNADPVLLHVAIIGLCEFFFSSRVLLENALGKGTVPEALADRYVALISDLVIEGIATR
jgi:TetR/AcrR family transcriptional regulator